MLIPFLLATFEALPSKGRFHPPTLDTFLLQSGGGPFDAMDDLVGKVEDISGSHILICVLVYCSLSLKVLDLRFCCFSYAWEGFLESRALIPVLTRMLQAA